MTGSTNAVVEVAGTAVFTFGRKIKIRHIAVTKLGASGDKIELQNVATDSDSGTELTIEGETVQYLHDLNIIFSKGLRIKPTGNTARYKIFFQ